MISDIIFCLLNRGKSITTNDENLKVATNSEITTDAEKAKPDFYPTPQYWVATSNIPQRDKRDWVISFRDIARATDARTMIATISPTVAAGNKLPLLMPELGISNAEYVKFAPLLLANLNSFVFDFVTRQKTQSTSMNWYIVEQLPLIKPEKFEQILGKTKIADYIRAEVLHLTYSAHDLAPFARDMGYVNIDGSVKPPIAWDATDRLHRQCRLDALFFNLYGIDRDDAAYILDQFPIVARQDEAAHGKYLIKELILAYMNAVKADDFTTVINL